MKQLRKIFLLSILASLALGFELTRAAPPSRDGGSDGNNGVVSLADFRRKKMSGSVVTNQLQAAQLLESLARSNGDLSNEMILRNLSRQFLAPIVLDAQIGNDESLLMPTLFVIENLMRLACGLLDPMDKTAELITAELRALTESVFKTLVSKPLQFTPQTRFLIRVMGVLLPALREQELDAIYLTFLQRQASTQDRDEQIENDGLISRIHMESCSRSLRSFVE